MIWVVFALMTGAAVLAFLWPLTRKPSGLARRELEAALYNSQIAELERDVERGLMSPEDANIARAEAARRLLSSSTDDAETAPSRNLVRVAALLAILVIPGLTLGLYGLLGAPDYRDLPLQARLEGQSGDVDIAAAIARIERHLADKPDDVRGWEILANVYRELGRAPDVVRVYRQLLRIQGASAQRVFGLGQALVYASDGSVSDEAARLFEQAIELDPSMVEPRYYLGLALEQKGQRDKAVEIYSKLVAEAPADAPWVGVLRERIARIKGDMSPAEAIAALPSSEREATIRTMVQGLADRLSSKGGSSDEWVRLVRAYSVLKDTVRAREVLEQARKAHPENARSFDALANELGLGG